MPEQIRATKSESKSFTCIICPLGCRVKLFVEGDRVIEVEGDRCPRGKEYVLEEFSAPKRTLTTTVRVEGGDLPVVPVRTANPIPKSQIFACMEELSRVSVEAPVKMGDIILKNILGTGVDVIATRTLKLKT